MNPETDQQIATTERLIIRQLHRGDAHFIMQLANTEGWLRYIGDRQIYSIDAAISYLEHGPMNSYLENGFGLFALQLKESGELVGMCGLINRKGLDDVDLGFAVLTNYEGKGLVKEAANATIAYAKNELKLERLAAITSVDNQRSIALLEKVGFQFSSPIRLPGDDETLNLYLREL